MPVTNLGGVCSVRSSPPDVRSAVRVAQTGASICEHKLFRKVYVDEFREPRYEASVSTVSSLALMVEYFGGLPLAKKGIRARRIETPCRVPSTDRITGTVCVGATLKLGGNFHSLQTMLNSRSMAALAGLPHLLHPPGPRRPGTYPRM
jgi:hypothetical protein